MGRCYYYSLAITVYYTNPGCYTKNVSIALLLKVTFVVWGSRPEI